MREYTLSIRVNAENMDDLEEVIEMWEAQHPLEVDKITPETED